MDRNPALAPHSDTLTDRFGRTISYLRLSVTDRCDLRCVYCMAARPDFLPRSELLTLEELTEVGEVFIRRGIRNIRITGGEPLVRRDVIRLIDTAMAIKPERHDFDIARGTGPAVARNMARTGG